MDGRTEQDGQAKIIVGASVVAGDRRHLYLLFERIDGSQIVVRGGPDTRAEGNEIGNLLGSTLLGSENYGHIVVDTAPYVAPYEAAFQRQADDSFAAIRLDQANPNDPSLVRDAHGDLIRRTIVAPDWPAPGETHERIVAWTGSDAELEKKLNAALKAGSQINSAQLEYSPLYNNSNGVVSNLMNAADVTPILPNDKDGRKVRAPNFGEEIYEDIGIGSNRSGNRFDGTQWYDNDGRKIQPPLSGQPVVPLDPTEHQRGSSGDFKISAAHQLPDDPVFGQIANGVDRMNASVGDVPKDVSDRMTWRLYALAKETGMDRVDDVALGRQGNNCQNGEYVFLIKGDPACGLYERQQIRTADAIETPVGQSQAIVQANGQQAEKSIDQYTQLQEAHQQQSHLRA